ncbi:MAG: site-specific integrase [Acidobacteriota bacterium]|nr:site-specific integrase [Acidobacteriota bacterium]
MGRKRRAWGKIATLPSGNHRASYIGPDGVTHAAANTFTARIDAETWLGNEKRLIDGDEWTPPAQRRAKRRSKTTTFSEYADKWLPQRMIKGQPLKPRTRAHYRKLLDNCLLPTFGKLPLPAITAESVTQWYVGRGSSTPTLTSHAYSLLRTILGSAVQEGLIASNPCHIRGAGNVTRAHKVKPLTLDELTVLVQAMPDKYRLLILLAAWCALRFGELAELRRKDIDVTNLLIKVRRGVVRADGEVVVGTPKSNAGSRDVAIPPHLLPAIQEHLKKHAKPGREGLVFPAAGQRKPEDAEAPPGPDAEVGQQLAPSTLYGKAPKRVKLPDGTVTWKGGTNFYRARAIAGHPALHFHDLRHTGAVLAAQTGATLAELMGRLGHSTPAAALRYQHAAADRDKAIAAALSALANGKA